MDDSGKDVPMRRYDLLEAGCKGVSKGIETLHVQDKRKKEIFLGRLFREFKTLTPLSISGLEYLPSVYLASRNFLFSKDEMLPGNQVLSADGDETNNNVHHRSKFFAFVERICVT